MTIIDVITYIYLVQKMFVASFKISKSTQLLITYSKSKTQNKQA